MLFIRFRAAYFSWLETVFLQITSTKFWGDFHSCCGPVISNCKIDAVLVTASYRKPFDLIFARNNDEWRAPCDHFRTLVFHKARPVSKLSVLSV